MSRIDLKKLLFIGVKDQKLKFFEEAQKLGLIHFIDTRTQKVSAPTETVTLLTQAIKQLSSYPVLKQEEPVDWSKAPRIAAEVLDLKHQIEEQEEKVRVATLEISRIDQYGEFNLSDVKYIESEGNRKVQFFCAKKGYFEIHGVPKELIYISSERGLDYYVSISEKSLNFEKVVELQFHKSLSLLKKEKKEAQEKLHALNIMIKERQKYHSFLHKALILAFNSKNLNQSSSYTADALEGSLFAVEGWVPSNKITDLEKLSSDSGVYQEEIAITEKDTVPTCLQNEGYSRIGEDLVHIYDTPSNTDKDPSLWVLSAFALFFAMIVNDAGYGLVYLLATGFLFYKFPNVVGSAKRMLKLALILCISCVVWGMLTTQFFGVEIPADSSLRSVSVLTWLSKAKGNFYLQQNGDVIKQWATKYPMVTSAQSGEDLWTMMSTTVDGKLVNETMDGLGKGILLELALLIGIIHLSLSFIRYLPRNWSGIGWIIVLIGGYLYFPHYLGETSLVQYAFGAPTSFGEAEGLQLIFFGIGLAVVLAIIQHRLGGLAEIMNLIQVFADVLSYLRLYALGLASGIVAQTINELGASMPFLIGIVVMVLAHIVNMGLGIMSGVIHGLRLNFLEWYHYSFEGGGKPYDPLRLHEVD